MGEAGGGWRVSWLPAAGSREGVSERRLGARKERINLDDSSLAPFPSDLRRSQPGARGRENPLRTARRLAAAGACQHRCAPGRQLLPTRGEGRKDWLPGAVSSAGLRFPSGEWGCCPSRKRLRLSPESEALEAEPLQRSLSDRDNNMDFGAAGRFK